MTPNDSLVPFTVPCYNRKDGCPSIVEYMDEPGSKPRRKLCPCCFERGAPSERMGIFGAVPRGRGDIPKHFMEYGSEPLYEVTVWPRASFINGGRIALHSPSAGGIRRKLRERIY